MNEDPDYKKKFVVEETESVLIPKINLRESENNIKNFNEDEKPEKNFFTNFLEKVSVLNFLRKDKFMNNEENTDKNQKDRKKKLKVLYIFLLISFVFLIVVGFLVYRVYSKGISLKTAFDNLVTSTQSKDLESVKKEISTVKTSLNDLDKAYEGIYWLRVVPFAGKFIDDGRHIINAANIGLESTEIVVDAITPYADIIGFNGDKGASENSPETTQDRLDFIVKTLPDLVPKVDTLSEKMSLVKKEVDNINPDDYPVSIGSQDVRERVRKVVELIDYVSEMVKNSKPLLEVSPYLMGVDSERTYLILFQNDKELRPTGGFITAYSIAKVKSGKFEPVLSDDIYNLIHFIYNARQTGNEDNSTRKKIIDNGWNREQASYAFKKADGKRTGMFEIPIFRSIEKRKILEEMEKRRMGGERKVY